MSKKAKNMLLKAAACSENFEKAILCLAVRQGWVTWCPLGILALIVADYQ